MILEITPRSLEWKKNWSIGQLILFRYNLLINSFSIQILEWFLASWTQGLIEISSIHESRSWIDIVAFYKLLTFVMVQLNNIGFILYLLKNI